MLTENDFQSQYLGNNNNDQALITKLSVVCLEAVTGHVARQGGELEQDAVRRDVAQVMELLGQNICRAGELYAKVHPERTSEGN